MQTELILQLEGGLSTNHYGMDALDAIYKHLHAHPEGSIDFSGVTFFSANFAAPLLAVLDDLGIERQQSIQSERPIRWEGMNENLLDILTRNAFCAQYRGESGANVVDERESAVPLRRFATSDADGYIAYLFDKLLDHHNFNKNLDEDRQETILKHYTEVFTNIEQHAHTDRPVYACGQYFPNEGKADQSKMIFTLTDLGRGFLPAISARDSSITEGAASIEWAANGRTTKDPNHPGGLGLSSICRFCRENPNTSIHVYSSGAYWEFDGKKTKTKRYEKPWFPGTTLHLIFQYMQTTHPEGYQATANEKP